MTDTDITTAARRIARTLNGYIGQGGKCVFDLDGLGGQWYSEGSYGFGPNLIVPYTQHQRITAREVQDILNNRKETQP